MPIRWISKENIGIALILLGACGFLQIFYVFISQYFLSVGSYLVIVIISSGATVCLFFASIVLYESFDQISRRKNLKSQFHRFQKEHPAFQKFLDFPITKPLILISIVFSLMFIISFPISNIYLDSKMSYIMAENIGVIVCLFVANFIEKNYARLKRI